MSKTMIVKLTFTEEVLGMASADPDIHRTYIASKAPDAKKMEEEVAAIGVDAVDERGTTVFPHDEQGRPFFWDYQIKGFFKDACGMLKRVGGTKSCKLRAYKKEIDGLIFPQPRRIAIHVPEGAELGKCSRPLRTTGPTGDRVALASSESVPAGSWVQFGVFCMKNDLAPLVKEWLAYGQMRGMAQWRNSGKGRFTYEVVEEQTIEGIGAPSGWPNYSD